MNLAALLEELDSLLERVSFLQRGRGSFVQKSPLTAKDRYWRERAGLTGERLTRRRKVDKRRAQRHAEKRREDPGFEPMEKKRWRKHLARKRDTAFKADGERRIENRRGTTIAPINAQTIAETLCALLEEITTAVDPIKKKAALLAGLKTTRGRYGIQPGQTTIKHIGGTNLGAATASTTGDGAKRFPREDANFEEQPDYVAVYWNTQTPTAQPNDNIRQYKLDSIDHEVFPALKSADVLQLQYDASDGSVSAL